MLFLSTPPAQSRAKKQPAAPKQQGGARKAPKRPAGTVTLRGLIEEGLLMPADDVLTVEYKGMITHASLTAEGRIRFKGELWYTYLFCSCCSPLEISSRKCAQHTVGGYWGAAGGLKCKCMITHASFTAEGHQIQGSVKQCRQTAVEPCSAGIWQGTGAGARCGGGQWCCNSGVPGHDHTRQTDSRGARQVQS